MLKYVCQNIDCNKDMLIHDYGNAKPILGRFSLSEGNMTQAELKQFITYDSETGNMKRKYSHYSDNSSLKSHGSNHNCGYRVLGIKGKSYLQHRLAWLYMTGEMPEFIDHKNGDRSDNRFCNLREATKQQNQCNQDRAGVYERRNKNSITYFSKIQVNYKEICLGTYKTKEEARAAYIKGSIKYHGEFSSRKNGGVS